MYIRKLVLASEASEFEFIQQMVRTCYNGVYPFNMFPLRDLREIDFSPITVFYGSNGSGKSTLLNILAEMAEVTRHSAFSGGAFFKEYTRRCELIAGEIPLASQMLTSDDVSDYLLNIRYLNDGIDVRRNELFDEYLDRKYSDHRLRSMADYDEWKQTHEAKQSSQSQFVRNRLMRNVDMQSNGETAMRFYVERIDKDALYLIDEPENSLSATLQKELADYILKSAKYFGCQFVISTHSPFFLAMPNARIYNLDLMPVRECHWTELENVRTYYDFFKEHERDF